MDLHETFYVTAGVAACRCICDPTAPSCPARFPLRYWESGEIFFIIMRMNRCFCLEVSEGGRQSVRRRRLEDAGPYPSHTSDRQFAILSERPCEVSGLPASLLPLPPHVVCRFPIAGEAKVGPGKTERERWEDMVPTIWARVQLLLRQKGFFFLRTDCLCLSSSQSSLRLQSSEES